MKIYTLTESIDYGCTYILGIYATAVRAKEACWQEAEAYPYLRNTMESTEDGNHLSVRVGTTVFEVDEHDVVAA
jgi:hypothetical protein